MRYIIIIILSYCIGSFSSAYIIGRLFKKIDIRDFGSGNVGATNALRVMGTKLGILTFIIDIFKGMFAVYLGKLILGDNGAVIGGICAVIGHNWPVFIKFKGGKGVATSLGALFMLNGPIMFIPLALAVVAVLISRYVSLASMVFLVTAPIIYFLLGKPFKEEYLLLSIVFAILGLIRHKDNIRRLIQGNENKLKIGR